MFNSYDISRRNTLTLILFVSLLINFAVIYPPVIQSKAAGNVYYVAIDGNNGNPGSEEHPWRTLEYGIDRLQAGDTLYVKAGTYTPGPSRINIVITGSGNNLAPITISGYGNDRPRIIPINGEDNGPGVWVGLVEINGSNIVFRQFEIAHSTGEGLNIWESNGISKNITIDNVWIHHTVNAGLIMDGSDNFQITNSRIWITNRINDPDGSWYRPNMWSGGVTTRNAKNIIIRGNEIFNSYGEGINIHGGADGVIIEGNILYDCFGPTIYPLNSVNVLVSRNLVYHTNDPEFLRNGNPGAGIVLADEARPGLMDNVKVINNLVVGTSNNFGFWSGHKAESGLKNSLIAHNTFVNADENIDDWTGAVIIESGQHNNSRFENNIILQNDLSVPITVVGNTSGISFSTNLWYPIDHLPESVRSPTDIYQDPKLMLSGLIEPGDLSSRYFNPLRSSPAINHAITSEVLEDYYKHLRGAKPDIGAIEYLLYDHFRFIPQNLGIYNALNTLLFLIN